MWGWNRLVPVSVVHVLHYAGIDRVPRSGIRIIPDFNFISRPNANSYLARILDPQFTSKIFNSLSILKNFKLHIPCDLCQL